MAKVPADGRKKLADVTPESYAGWAEIASRHGTNVTALAEVMGHYFAEMGNRAPSAAMERVLERARKLTQDRARRPQT